MKYLVYIIIFLTYHANAQKIVEVEKLGSSDREIGDSFGWSVAVDGEYSIIGAYSEYDIATSPYINTYAGAAYVFKVDSLGGWIETQKLMASDRMSEAYFGYSVDIEGDIAVVGAPQAGWTTQDYNFGVVYIFRRDSVGIWSEIQRIENPDQHRWDMFGNSVAIDGKNLIVGCPDCSLDTNGQNYWGTGSVFFYKIDTSGVFQFNGRLFSSNFQKYGGLGYSVDINDSTAIAGCYKNDFDEVDADSLDEAGAAFIYRMDPSGEWNQVQKIVASNRAHYSHFGRSVSIDDDFLLVGAPNHYISHSDQGMAYVFHRDSTNYWNETQSWYDASAYMFSYFGASVAIKGKIALIGEPGYEQANVKTGAIQYFSLDSINQSWNPINKLIGTDLENQDGFGSSLAVTGDQCMVGAPRHSLDGNGQSRKAGAGAAYYLTLGCLDDSIQLFRRGEYLVGEFAEVDSVEWVYCDSNQVLTSLERDSIFISKNGFYKVVLHRSYGCADTSDCFFVGDVNVSETNILANVSIFPNPTRDKLFLKGVGDDEGLEYSLFDITGLKIKAGYTSGKSINLVDLPPGIYHLQLSLKSTQKVFKVLIE